MELYWIPLPAAWELQDVQAALNVIVSLLSALCIFVFARMCWQTATAQVVKNRNVPLAALFSVTTVGEVFDVCRLLGVEILSSYYLRILAQCLIVTCLTVAAFLSGPIARFSTSIGHKVVNRDVHGLLANRLNSGLSHESVLWHNTWTALDRAGFPRNRLLDYFPPNDVNWKYEADKWNSSWSMSCNKTDLTSINLYVQNDNCSSMNTALPAMAAIFPETTYQDNTTWSTYQKNWEGAGKNDFLSDVLLFRFSFVDSDYNNDTETYDTVRVVMLSVHLQNLQKETNSSSYCDFGKGKVGNASYTKAVCDIEKVKNTTIKNDLVQGAYADMGSLDFVPMAYTSYFQARFIREINAGNATSVISSDDLIRFYQVYQITQDTQYNHPVTRRLAVEVSLVRISTIFLISMAVLALLCVLGTAKYGVFSIRNYHAVSGTPQSKLDWMLQSIEKNRANMTPVSGRQSRLSVNSLRSPDVVSPPSVKRKSDFETATYGLTSPEPSTPYHSGWLSRQISGRSDTSGYFPLQPVPTGDRDSSEVSLLTRFPSARAQPFTTDYHPPQAFANDYQIHR